MKEDIAKDALKKKEYSIRVRVIEVVEKTITVNSVSKVAAVAEIAEWYGDDLLEFIF